MSNSYSPHRKICIKYTQKCSTSGISNMCMCDFKITFHPKASQATPYSAQCLYRVAHLSTNLQRVTDGEEIREDEGVISIHREETKQPGQSQQWHQGHHGLQARSGR